MIITIFGGSGATGRLLIGQALDEGHHVTAYLRPPVRLGIVHDRLHIVTGDLTNAAAIDTAIDGADGVISLLGQGSPQTGTPIARATRNIVASMQKFGVRRLVVVATVSVLAPNDQPAPLTRLGIRFAKRFMRASYDDVIATAKVVSESGLDWTIVRPPVLTDGPRTGHVSVGYLGDGVTGTSLTRANAADIMLELVGSRQYIGKAPVVTDEKLSNGAAAESVEIAPGVHCLRLGAGITSTNTYFVESGKSWVLIDSSGPNRAAAIKSGAEALFGVGTRPAAILQTHLHTAHAGSTLDLARDWGLPVYVHPDERPLTAGGYAPGPPSGGAVSGPISRLLAQRERERDLASVVHAFDPEAGVPGLPDWQCIATPGHTPGHASFFRPDDRVLIAGDAVLTVNVNSPAEPSRHRQRVSGPPRHTTWNWTHAKDSIASLAALEPRVLASGHGIPMIGDAVAPALLSYSASTRQLDHSHRPET